MFGIRFRSGRLECVRVMRKSQMYTYSDEQVQVYTKLCLRSMCSLCKVVASMVQRKWMLSWSSRQGDTYPSLYRGFLLALFIYQGLRGSASEESYQDRGKAFGRVAKRVGLLEDRVRQSKPRIDLRIRLFLPPSTVISKYDLQKDERITHKFRNNFQRIEKRIP